VKEKSENKRGSKGQSTGQRQHHLNSLKKVNCREQLWIMIVTEEAEAEGAETGRACNDTN
jgi:hypothetical protein